MNAKRSSLHTHNYYQRQHILIVIKIFSSKRLFLHLQARVQDERDTEREASKKNEKKKKKRRRRRRREQDVLLQNHTKTIPVIYIYIQRNITQYNIERQSDRSVEWWNYSLKIETANRREYHTLKTAITVEKERSRKQK